MGDGTEHADCVVGGGIGCEGVEVGGQDSRRCHGRHLDRRSLVEGHLAIERSSSMEVQALGGDMFELPLSNKVEVLYALFHAFTLHTQRLHRAEPEASVSAHLGATNRHNR